MRVSVDFIQDDVVGLKLQEMFGAAPECLWTLLKSVCTISEKFTRLGNRADIHFRSSLIGT